MSSDSIEPAHIDSAAERIAPWVLRTPLLPFDDTGVLLKAENLQPSGAFKLRGAFNTLLQLPEAARRRGVVAHSSGNHAVAVAYAAGKLGIAATIVMPDNAPAVKLDWTRSLGATVDIVGPSSSERAQRADELSEAQGLAPVQPYDAVTIMEATATITREILADLDAAEHNGPVDLFVPVSGGGLIAGMALAAKQARRPIRVIGVEPELAADALASMRAGHRVELPAEQMAATLADGLRVAVVGERTWPYIQSCVDEIVTVSEDEIRATMARIVATTRMVAEPSGAVAPAAAIRRRGARNDALRVAVVSGGNVDPLLLRSMLSE
ncbi:MAG: threonine/serine dehydratase [Gammaproteobacteria bacterium]|nr:MAG: threonine/serine dehydratase [Gammaproteobacteria bacterium]